MALSPRASHAELRPRIELVLGPMFSGKSSEVLRRVRRAQFSKLTTMVVRYVNDNRYSEMEVATHDRVKMAAISACSLMPLLGAFGASTPSPDVIGIDEGQFFPDSESIP